MLDQAGNAAQDQLQAERHLVDTEDDPEKAAAADRSNGR
jgi:hypothetical protein